MAPTHPSSPHTLIGLLHESGPSLPDVEAAGPAEQAELLDAQAALECLHLLLLFLLTRLHGTQPLTQALNLACRGPNNEREATHAYMHVGV